MVRLVHPTFRLRGGDVTTSPPLPEFETFQYSYISRAELSLSDLFFGKAETEWVGKSKRQIASVLSQLVPLHAAVLYKERFVKKSYFGSLSNQIHKQQK